METFSALLALCAGNSPVIGEFPSQRLVARSFDVLFRLRWNKWLRKQSERRWFETPSRSLWRHCNVEAVAETIIMVLSVITSSNGGFFRVHQWIPLTKGQWRRDLMFLRCWPEKIVEQTLEWPVICDTMMLIWCLCSAIMLVREEISTYKIH